jgi:hypothetical protein
MSRGLFFWLIGENTNRRMRDRVRQWRALARIRKYPRPEKRHTDKTPLVKDPPKAKVRHVFTG